MNRLLITVCVGLILPVAAWAGGAPASAGSDQDELLREGEMRDFLEHPPTVSAIEIHRRRIVIKQIACWASENAPRDAVRLFLDNWGVVYGRFAPLCGEWIISKKVPEIDALLRQYDKVSGWISYCGSLSVDVSHARSLLEWRAAIDARPTDEATIDRAEPRFPKSFEKWAQQGIWEKEQYHHARALRDAAIGPLERYYRRQFGLKGSHAHHLAAYYLNAITDIDLDRAPRDWSPRGVEDVRNFLRIGEVADEELLGLAIVNDFSVPDIKTILNALPLKASLSSGGHSGGGLDAGQVVARETPLMEAAAARRPDVMAVLLARGRWDVNAQNWFGKTALMYAVQYNDAEEVNLLLSHGADPNLATFALDQLPGANYCREDHLDAGRRTPLMYAAWHAALVSGIISRLIGAGADPFARDDRGETAFDYLARSNPRIAWEQAAAALCTK